jgi:small subunit ribosomal protein S1
MASDTIEQEESVEEENFADLLAKSYTDPGRLEPGQKVTARVLSISGDWVFIDTGRKGEGVLDRKELLDPDGNLTVAVGDAITAWFISASGSELRFTTKVGGGSAGNAQLEEAWASGIPVEGFVEKEIKGGFEVKIGGSLRAFCPFSQIDLRRADASADYVGKHLSFRISEYGERGRNIVLSRRLVLEEERNQEKETLRETLAVGQTVRGTVTSLRDFGAFVSVGGIEGLLPISEVGWGRVADISEHLSVGQEIEVAIKSLDWEKERFSFSLKDTLPDPWEKAVQSYPEGSYVTGRVARLANFGAFVTLGEGIDGLLPISRLGGGKRINHPRDVLKDGERIEVKVESIDRGSRRISLSLAEASRAAAQAEEEMADFRKTAAEGSARSLGSLGDLLKGKLGKGT